MNRHRFRIEPRNRARLRALHSCHGSAARESARDAASGDKGAAPKTPQEQCLARSAKTLDKCKAECAKDFDKQVRCTNHCEVASSKREAECKKPT